MQFEIGDIVVVPDELCPHCEVGLRNPIGVVQSIVPEKDWPYNESDYDESDLEHRGPYYPVSFD
jgi:hypothetical protein